jgi:hypothetical protein
VTGLLVGRIVLDLLLFAFLAAVVIRGRHGAK